MSLRRLAGIALAIACLMSETAFAQAPAGTTLGVPVGAELRATLEGKEHTARVAPAPVPVDALDLRVGPLEAGCVPNTFRCAPFDARGTHYVVPLRNEGPTTATGIRVRPSHPGACADALGCDGKDYAISVWRGNCTYGNCQPCRATGSGADLTLECPDAVDPGETVLFEIAVRLAGGHSVRDTFNKTAPPCAPGEIVIPIQFVSDQPDRDPANNGVPIPAQDPAVTPALRIVRAMGDEPKRTYVLATSFLLGHFIAVEARFPQWPCPYPASLEAYVEFKQDLRGELDLELFADPTEQGVYRSRPTRVGSLAADPGRFLLKDGRMVATLKSYPSARAEALISSEPATIEIQTFDELDRPSPARVIPISGRYRARLRFRDPKSPASSETNHEIVLEFLRPDFASETAVAEVVPVPGEPGHFQSDLFVASVSGTITARHFGALPPSRDANIVRVEDAEEFFVLGLDGPVIIPFGSLSEAVDHKVAPGDSFGFAQVGGPPANLRPIDLVVEVISTETSGRRARVAATTSDTLGPRMWRDQWFARRARRVAEAGETSVYYTPRFVAGTDSILGDLRPGDRVRAINPGSGARSDWVIVAPVPAPVVDWTLHRAPGASPVDMDDTVAQGDAVQARLLLADTTMGSTAFAKLDIMRNGSLVSTVPLTLRRQDGGSSTFLSEPLTTGAAGVLSNAQIGDQLRARYAELATANSEPVERVAVLGVVPRPAVVDTLALQVLAPDGEVTSGHDVTLHGQVRIAVAFSHPPAEQNANVELRTVRGSEVTREMLVVVTPASGSTTRYESAPIPVSGDGRLSHVRPGDRIEGRYGSGPWAATPAATATVIGRPGVLRAARFVAARPPHAAVRELAPGTPYAVELEFEAPPDDQSLPLTIETGPPVAERVPAGDQRAWGGEVASTTRWTKPDPTTPEKHRTPELLLDGVRPGYVVRATYGTAVVVASMGAAGVPAGHGRVEVVGRDAFGHPIAVPVTFNLAGKTPGDSIRGATNARMDVPAGTYDITVDFPGARYLEFAFRVQAGRERRLTPPGALGAIRFDVRDARNVRLAPRVIIEKQPSAQRTGSGWDAAYAGLAGEPAVMMPAGTYRLRLEDGPFGSDERTITVSGGTTTTVTLAPRGRLIATATGFDGRPLACTVVARSETETRSTAAGHVLDLRPGRFEIAFHSTIPFTTTVDIRAGEEHRVAAPRLGRLQVNASDALGQPTPVQVQVASTQPNAAQALTWTSGRAIDVPEGEYRVTYGGDRTVVAHVRGGEITAVDHPDAGKLGRLRVRLPPDFDRRFAREYEVQVISGSRVVSRRGGLGTLDVSTDVPVGKYDVRIAARSSEVDAVYALGVLVRGVAVSAGENPVVLPGDLGTLSVEIRSAAGELATDRLNVFLGAANLVLMNEGRSSVYGSRHVFYTNPGTYLVGGVFAPPKAAEVSAGRDTPLVVTQFR